MAGVIDPVEAEGEEIRALRFHSFYLSAVQVCHQRQVIVFSQMDVITRAIGIPDPALNRFDYAGDALILPLMVARPQSGVFDKDFRRVSHLSEVGRGAAVRDEQKVLLRHLAPHLQQPREVGVLLMRKQDVEHFRHARRLPRPQTAAIQPVIVARQLTRE